MIRLFLRLIETEMARDFFMPQGVSFPMSVKSKRQDVTLTNISVKTNPCFRASYTCFEYEGEG